MPKASEFYKKLLKNDEIGPGLLSKVAGAVLPNFQERTINRTYLTDLKTGKVNPGRFQKLSVQLREIYYPKGAKALESPGF